MATYYHGNSEIQGSGSDGLQTLILMNPGYVGYSDTQQSQPPPNNNNFVFLNNHHGNNSLNFSHAPPSTQTQQFVGIPLTATASSVSPTAVSNQDGAHASSVHSQHDISSLHGFMSRVPYNMYNQTIDFTAARDVPRSQHGLSLSLSPQQPAYASFRPERDVQSQAMVTAISPAVGDDVRGSGGSSSSVSGVSNGVNGMQSVLVSSKYLKAARDLLEEVVNVGKGVKTGGESGKGTKNIGESSVAGPAGGDGQSERETSVKHSGPELTTAERQEIQMKKAKLVNMLDEVEQRYRQYHHQMQIVISWFEQAAGIGSAKTYTALALQTISKQFRCLKDAILGQIRAAGKSLGDEDSFGGKMEGSKLKFVDNQLRQQRALQQLGMIQHNAWRPQRGLPERSVSVLRAWLFEHFLHPYPKDSDKIMLAKQTGLTRSQVSNWFINARVRLWKPMVEEMYAEEVKEQEKNASEDKTSKSDQNEDSTSKISPSQEKSSGFENQSKKSFMPKMNNASSQNITSPIPMSTVSTSPTMINFQNQSGFNLIDPSEMDSISHGSPKKPRSSEMLHSPTSAPSRNIDREATNAHNEQQSRDGFTLMGAPTNFIGGFGSYTMGELGRFGADQFPGSYSGNGVSLTLGLPHCENLSMSGNHQNFLPNQNIQLGRGMEIEENEFGNINTPTSTHSTNVYDSINIQNRKRYATQLLPDFVT